MNSWSYDDVTNLIRTEWVYAQNDYEEIVFETFEKLEARAHWAHCDQCSNVQSTSNIYKNQKSLYKNLVFNNS